MHAVDAPRIEPAGPWVEAVIATPSGTFQWPPEPYDWGSVVVKCKSPSRKDNQKAAGRRKAKTKKSGPEPILVTLEFTFVRTAWEGSRGMCALLNAIDPNGEGEGGPFDLQAADFTRRGGKAIDVDEVGEVVWRGAIGTCTVTAKEWVPEPPKESTQGTTAPDKSTEYVPGDETQGAGEVGANGVLIARTGIARRVQEIEVDAAVAAAEEEERQQDEVFARPVARRGFDGPENPGAGP